MLRYQECVTHFKNNILTYVKADHKEQIAKELREVFIMTGQKPIAPSRLEQNYKRLLSTGPLLTERDDLYYYFTYPDFAWQIRSMIYTNWFEQLNKSFRRSLKN